MGVIPAERTAAAAVWTSGEVRGVSPEGRSPTSFRSTEMDPSRVERALFSSATASFMRPMNVSFSFSSSARDSDRMSTSIQCSTGMELTEVPPPTTPTLNVVFGVDGTFRRPNFCMALPMANAGLTRPNAP